MAFVDIREKEILRLRKKKKSLQQIGNKFWISKERVRQILSTLEKPEILKTYYCPRKKYIVPDGFRRCYRCKKNYPNDFFYSGVRNECKNCSKKVARKYAGKYIKLYRKGGKYYKAQKARSYLNHKIKTGLVVKGKCEMEGLSCSGVIEGHHYLGYSKKNALKVKWYCKKHHKEIDGRGFFRKT